MDLYQEKKQYKAIGIITGILGLILWVIPGISIIVNITCLFCGAITREAKGETSKVIYSLGVSGLILTIVRTVVVFLVG